MKNIEEELSKILSEELAKNIDKEIINAIIELGKENRISKIERILEIANKRKSS